MKKKLHNGRRGEGGLSKPTGDEEPRKPEISSAERERIEFDAGVVDYLRVVTSLIEQRQVSREEILEMLRRTMRQRSLARERRLDYVVRSLKEDPP